MKKKNWYKESVQKGSLMVEALALLGLITMVTPVLYKKAAERTTELQDINVATQMRMVSTAVDNFLKDHYKEISETHNTGTQFKLSDAERDKLDEYLPYGFATQKSKMFKDFDIAVRRREVEDSRGRKHNIYTGAVLAPLEEDINLIRSSKIASMIGANGGVYKDAQLQGVQGTWNADLADYGFSADELKTGSLAVVSAQAISSAKGDVTSEEVLFRIEDGDDNKNRMFTTLYMDGNPVREVKEIIASSTTDTVYIGSVDGSEVSNLVVDGTTKLLKTLEVIEDTVLNAKLNVKGDTDLDATLNVDGATTLKDTLTVTKATTLQSTLNVNGNTDLDGTLNVDNDATLQAKLNVKKDADIDGTLNVDGATTLKSSLTVDGNTFLKSGVEITGSATVSENLKVKKDGSFGGKLDVTGAGTFGGDLTVGGKLNLTGDLDVGGNLTVAKKSTFNDAVTINSDSFTVGKAATRIKVTDDLAFFGNKYVSGGDSTGLTVTASELVLRNSKGLLNIDEDGVVLDVPKVGRLKLEGDGAVIGVGTEGSETSKLVITDDKAGFEQTPSADSDTYSIYLNSGELDIASKGVRVDKYGMAFAGEGGDIAALDNSIKLTDSKVDETSILNGSQVAISRKGIIEVKAPTDDTDGFIRARRLVSDVEYPEDGLFHGYKSDGTTTNMVKYDYYQVNPAYTSVMNDIKLASRGGARLSDILPDFINKGIYVVDNTYKETAVGSWSSMAINSATGQPSTAKDECTNNACVASPWMGFVPAPQCPRAYAKAVVLNPIRWRMSEVYSVVGANSWAESAPSQADYKKIISGDGNADNTASLFRQNFLKVTNPKAAGFKLTEGGATTHSHQIESGYPLTFQTNTWLNTTIELKYSTSTAANQTAETAIGWHAIMGFVYTPGQYKTLLSEIGACSGTECDDNDMVYWNIFPVYAGDMATVANVYCYFDRHPLNKSDGTRSWSWSGAGSPVYQYDQLNNYRHGNSKEKDGDAAAVGNLNDPQLSYNDVW